MTAFWKLLCVMAFSMTLCGVAQAYDCDAEDWAQCVFRKKAQKRKRLNKKKTRSVYSQRSRLRRSRPSSPGARAVGSGDRRHRQPSMASPSSSVLKPAGAIRGSGCGVMTRSFSTADTDCRGRGGSVTVNTQKNTLFVCNNDGSIHSAYPVSLGTNGVGKLRQGDRKTPLGTFKITHIRKSTAKKNYHRFAHLNYPTPAMRRAGFTGGSVGIHGPPNSYRCNGQGNANVDWTAGCVALPTNATVDRVFGLVARLNLKSVHIIDANIQPTNDRPVSVAAIHDRARQLRSVVQARRSSPVQSWWSSSRSRGGRSFGSNRQPSWAQQAFTAD